MIKHSDRVCSNAKGSPLTPENQKKIDSFNAMQAEIDKGLESGISNRTIQEIWAEVERQYDDIEK